MNPVDAVILANRHHLAHIYVLPSGWVVKCWCGWQRKHSPSRAAASLQHDIHASQAPSGGGRQ